MKRQLVFCSALALSLMVLGSGCQRTHAHLAQAMHHGLTAADDFAVKREVRQTFTLKPGDEVNVSGINGLLEVTTSDTAAAELYIVRSAREEAHFAARKLTLEQVGNKLTVRFNNDRGAWSMLGERAQERQRAYLKLPRAIQLAVSGINGKTDIGAVNGKVNLSGINGPVSVAQATGELDVSGINGNIEVSVAQLAGRGINASGINGNLQLHFVGEANADIDVSGFNGRVNVELPNTNVKTNRRGAYEARIGNGGTNIDISGLNGNVNLLPAALAR